MGDKGPYPSPMQAVGNLVEERRELEAENTRLRSQLERADELVDAVQRSAQARTRIPIREALLAYRASRREGQDG